MARRMLPALILLCVVSAGFAQPAVRTLRLDPGAQRRPGMPPRERRAEPVTGTASVSGRVTTADTGAPLRRALVRVSGDALGQSRATLTDSDGRFFEPQRARTSATPQSRSGRKAFSADEAHGRRSGRDE